jgi:hypothetical protein
VPRSDRSRWWGAAELMLALALVATPWSLGGAPTWTLWLVVGLGSASMLCWSLGAARNHRRWGFDLALLLPAFAVVFSFFQLVPLPPSLLAPRAPRPRPRATNPPPRSRPTHPPPTPNPPKPASPPARTGSCPWCATSSAPAACRTTARCCRPSRGTWSGVGLLPGGVGGAGAGAGAWELGRVKASEWGRLGWGWGPAWGLHACRSRAGERGGGVRLVAPASLAGVASFMAAAGEAGRAVLTRAQPRLPSTAPPAPLSPRHARRRAPHHDQPQG